MYIPAFYDIILICEIEAHRLNKELEYAALWKGKYLNNGMKINEVLYTVSKDGSRGTVYLLLDNGSKICVLNDPIALVPNKKDLNTFESLSDAMLWKFKN